MFGLSAAPSCWGAWSPRRCRRAAGLRSDQAPAKPPPRRQPCAALDPPGFPTTHRTRWFSRQPNSRRYYNVCIVEVKRYGDQLGGQLIGFGVFLIAMAKRGRELMTRWTALTGTVIAVVVAALSSCGGGTTTTIIERDGQGSATQQSDIEIPPETAEHIIEKNVARNGGLPNRSTTCIAMADAPRSFSCTVETAGGFRSSVIVRCEEPRGVDSAGRIDADCVAGPPGS